MKQSLVLAAFILCLVCVSPCIQAIAEAITQKPIAVIVCSYNNAPWYKKNLDSIVSQQYNNYRVIYIDDASNDHTYELVRTYVKSKKLEDRIFVVRNQKNMGALYSTYHVVHQLPDETIIVIVDGDDWLAHSRVLAAVNETYTKEKVLLTYGQFVRHPSGKRGICKPYPNDVVLRNGYREHDWIASHLRTFYAGLFKKIKQEDLMDGGEFLRVTIDVAQMLPMLEMAGGRYKCMDETLYVYNHQNPLSHFVRAGGDQYQEERAKIVRSKPKYEAVSEDEARALSG